MSGNSNGGYVVDFSRSRRLNLRLVSIFTPHDIIYEVLRIIINRVRLRPRKRSIYKRATLPRVLVVLVGVPSS